MVDRGRVPSDYERRQVQAPGLMRHGPFPGLNSSSNRQSNESPSLTEVLENKIKVQAEDIDQLSRDNHKMAATHVNLKQELIDAQEEVERLRAHIRSIHTESDIQIRVFVDKMGKMEGNVKGSEEVKRDLQRAHKDAQILAKAREELTVRVQQATRELENARMEIKNLPKLMIELDNLRQEHQRLRATFEYEKGKNIDLVEQLHAMEKNLIGMSQEVERVRSEVTNAEMRVKANPYGLACVNSNPPIMNPAQSDGGMGRLYGPVATGYWMPEDASNGVAGGEVVTGGDAHRPPQTKHVITPHFPDCEL